MTLNISGGVVENNGVGSETEKRNSKQQVLGKTRVKISCCFGRKGMTVCVYADGNAAGERGKWKMRGRNGRPEQCPGVDKRRWGWCTSGGVRGDG